MSQSRYLVWSAGRFPGGCVLLPLAGVERTFRLLDGEALLAGFPSDATFSMDPDLPDDMLLTDALTNVDMLIVASPRLKEIFEARAAPSLEYLPVTILDHRGLPAEPGYFILHPTDPVDCLEVDQCGVTRSSIDPSTIDDVERLVLDERRIPSDRLLFRPLGFPRAHLVRRDVAEEITRQGLTPIRWVELSDYPEI